MDTHIKDIEFTIFDTETTGLEASGGDRIVEIAALRIKGTERIAAFESLVNPKRAISDAAFAVNKITPEMLKNAPAMQEVMPGFLDFIKGSCLCSYNAGFDLEFLNNELKLAGKKELEGVIVIDILKMAKRLLPHLERHALWCVAEKFGLKSKQQHRALSDVELTLEAFYKLNALLEAKGITSFTQFTNLFAINPHILEGTTAGKLAQIQEAINLGTKLKIKYLSSSGLEVTEREVLPKEIKQEKNHSYVVGYCCLRKDERVFRVDGILQMELVA